MTADRAKRETSETATRLATGYWQKQTGSTNVFDLTRPADVLTLRIALQAVARGDEKVVFPEIPDVDMVQTNDAWQLSLTDALCVAARNDRGYQRLKDAIYAAALDLDYQQFQFGTTFSGMLAAMLSGTPENPTATGDASAGFRRQFENGTTIAGKLALDVVQLLRDDWRSVGLTGDLSMSVPLMRGSGREIVREPLTLAEQRLLYAIRRFEYYRQTYAVTVASGYYGVLEYAKRLQNATDNEANLQENGRRADMLYAAGRMQSIQLDMARSDLLRANENVISMRRTYQARLDAFKLTLGLPPEARIVLDSREMEVLSLEVDQIVKSQKGPEERFPDEAEACEMALEHRQDLVIAYGELEDAKRAVKIAADALQADVSVNTSVKSTQMERTGASDRIHGESWNAGVRTDLPWNRRRERNEYRKSLLNLEAAARALEEKQDTITLGIRNGLRNLAAAAASYKIQLAALRVAEMRVESNALFLQSGRATMRDILEAQTALLSARNALCAALVTWRISELELRRDMGTLEISGAGTWRRGMHG